MSYTEGGRIRIPEDTGEGYRLSDGVTVVSRATFKRYGLRYLTWIFPNTAIHIAEDLIASYHEDDQDRPETPGGQL